MGGPCEIQLHAKTAAQAAAWFDAARVEILRLESKFSRYRGDSLTAKINRTAGNPSGIVVDAETAALLDFAHTAWQQSGGVFDLSSGVLRRVWDFRVRKIPGDEELAATLECVGWHRIRWSSPRLVLPIAGMELDFGGLVKEYAADRAVALMRAAGARHGLVELAGDISLLGPNPDGSPWQIGIRDPRSPEGAIATVAIGGGAIASSGDYARCFEYRGKRYAHILDPKTGWPVMGLQAVSVIADRCLIAGVVSTIAMLKGETAGCQWLIDSTLPHLWVDPRGRVGGTLATASIA